MSSNVRTPFLVAIAVVVLAAIAIFVEIKDFSRFDSWTREDGPVENLQAALYAVGSACFFVVAFRDRRNAWAWLFALGLLFCAGEEISWGQRIFGFATPAELEGANIQHEANLHNVENIHGNVRTYGFMALGVLFVILPIAELTTNVVSVLRRKIGFIRVPMYVVPLAAAAFGFMLIPRYIDQDAFGFDEVGELFTALAMCAYGLGVRRTTDIAGVPELQNVVDVHDEIPAMSSSVYTAAE